MKIFKIRGGVLQRLLYCYHNKRDRKPQMGERKGSSVEKTKREIEGVVLGTTKTEKKKEDERERDRCRIGGGQAGRRRRRRVWRRLRARVGICCFSRGHEGMNLIFDPVNSFDLFCLRFFKYKNYKLDIYG